MPQPLTRRRIVALGAAAWLLASALATSSVSFEAQGYLLDLVVSGSAVPEVTALTFSAPGSHTGSHLRSSDLRVTRFSPTRKLLTLNFVNPGDAAMPGDFTLTVHHDRGVLVIEGHTLVGRFTWGR